MGPGGEGEGGGVIVMMEVCNSLRRKGKDKLSGLSVRAGAYGNDIC